MSYNRTANQITQGEGRTLRSHAAEPSCGTTVSPAATKVKKRRRSTANSAMVDAISTSANSTSAGAPAKRRRGTASSAMADSSTSANSIGHGTINTTPAADPSEEEMFRMNLPISWHRTQRPNLIREGPIQPPLSWTVGDGDAGLVDNTSLFGSMPNSLHSNEDGGATSISTSSTSDVITDTSVGIPHDEALVPDLTTEAIVLNHEDEPLIPANKGKAPILIDEDQPPIPPNEDQPPVLANAHPMTFIENAFLKGYVRALEFACATAITNTIPIEPPLADPALEHPEALAAFWRGQAKGLEYAYLSSLPNAPVVEDVPNPVGQSLEVQSALLRGQALALKYAYRLSKDTA